jgi:putative FmdB family regulatory protein
VTYPVSSSSIESKKEVAFVPIYEYECDACNHRFEVIQKVSDKPVRKCVLCRGKVHKVLSAPGLLFKGSGWYVTDYANPERKRAMEAEKKAGTPDSDSVKTETKPETKEPKKTSVD